MRNKTISIIIPAKNEEKYIRCCLESVKCLKYPKDFLEIILVDNGSEDKTRDIAKSFDVNVLSFGGDSISSVRNYGAQNSKGEILAFLDADSVVPPDWIMSGLTLLEGPEVSCVGFSFALPGAESSWVERNWHFLSCNAKRYGTMRVNWLPSFNLLVKREKFEAIGGFDESLKTCEDVDFGERLSAMSTVLFSDTVSVKHLGGARTLKEFFLKEIWRGKSSFAKMRNTKRYFSDFLSTWVPVFYLFTVAFGWIPIMKGEKYFFLYFMFLLFTPFAMIVKKNANIPLRNMGRVWVLGFSYLCARGLSIFSTV